MDYLAFLNTLLNGIGQILNPFTPQSGEFFFTHFAFWVFFTLWLTVYVFAANSATGRLTWLMIGSIYVFIRFSGGFVALILGSALVDWAAALAIHQARKNGLKLFFLWGAIAINLGLLGYFKYTLFFIEIWNQFITPDAPLSISKIIAPIGISYYTFRSLSYLLDVYYETIESPETNYFRYFNYLSFFPLLIAGPINRSASFLSELQKPYFISRADFSQGTLLLLTGLVKKIVFADVLSNNFVNRVFEAPEAFTGFENLTASFLFGWQLYFDFSGYSDMAIGLALLLGFKVESNFERPFRALNISEFWRKWHISLSKWFTDYLFTPLNFSLRSGKKLGLLIAILFTFFLSGIWHGAGYTFLFWGLAHGIALSFEALTANIRKKIRLYSTNKIYQALYAIKSWAITMLFLTFTFILFRANNLSQAKLILNQIYRNFSPEIISNWLEAYQSTVWVAGIGIVIALIPQRWQYKIEKIYHFLPWWLQIIVAVLVIIGVYQAYNSNVQPFVYLKF